MCLTKTIFSGVIALALIGATIKNWMSYETLDKVFMIALLVGVIGLVYKFYKKE